MLARVLTDAMKERIAARATRFDPLRLLDLLASYGIQREDVLFESNPERASASVVESVRFEPDGTTVIRVNMGLMGDRGTLPVYFQQLLEQGGATDSFHEFIRFFDDRLVSNLLRVTYPERDPALFSHWPTAVESFRRMSVLGCEGLLQSVLAKTFPELRVHVKRAAIPRSNKSSSLVMGDGGLDGGSLLGEGRTTEPQGFEVTLVAMEPTAGGGRRWPEAIMERFTERVEPVLSGSRLVFDLNLVVVDHEERAELQGIGFLGYERVGGSDSSVHRLQLFRGAVGADPIGLP